MEYIAKITEEQANLLRGNPYATDSFFNPVLDCDGDWIISSQEIENCENPIYSWVKDLQQTLWCGPYIPISGFTMN